MSEDSGSKKKSGFFARFGEAMVRTEEDDIWDSIGEIQKSLVSLRERIDQIESDSTAAKSSALNR